MFSLRIIKELFFPRWCCGCKRYGELLCSRCFSMLQFSNETIYDHVSLSSISSLLMLEPISRSMIHQLKYNSVKEVAVLCARMMFLYGSIPKSEVITSIPLHPYRQNSRGFNQAEEIARELAKLLHQPFITTLYRSKHSINLASIKDVKIRKKVISGQFTINPVCIPFIQNKKVLLIDDVWTTNATLGEAANTLLQGNPTSIDAFTFAHGV